MSNVILNTADMSGRESYRLLTSIVTPRPIAWVSTISAEGITNLAPFSFFNAVTGEPPTVMISVGQRAGQAKDTLRNIQATGEFVVNLVDEAHAVAMNQTSGDWSAEQSEFEVLGIPTLPAIAVRPPLVAGVPVALEVKATQFIPIQDSGNVMVLGQVIHFHVRADLLTPDNLVNTPEMQLIGRLGGSGYTKMGEVFHLERPIVK